MQFRNARQKASKAVRITMHALLTIFIACLVIGVASIHLFHDMLPADIPEAIHSYMFTSGGVAAISLLAISLIIQTKKEKSSISS